MNELQLLEKEFTKTHPSKGMQYINPTWDFLEVQLDGYYTADDLRKIANSLDEYNDKASNINS